MVFDYGWGPITLAEMVWHCLRTVVPWLLVPGAAFALEAGVNHYLRKEQQKHGHKA